MQLRSVEEAVNIENGYVWTHWLYDPEDVFPRLIDTARSRFGVSRLYIAWRKQ